MGVVRFRGLVILITLLAITTPFTSLSAARSTSGGITVAPFLQQVTIQPTEAEKSFSLSYTNRTAGLQELDLKTQDFGSLNDTGGVLLEGSKSDYSHKYGLTSWLTLESDTVVLQPGETHQILVTVNNRNDLQPGGHYGAVAATVNSLTDDSGDKVVVNQQLLSLIFVDKVGGEHYDLKLAGVEPNGNWLHLPSSVKLHFQNPGNVHVIPRGVVKLKSSSGKVVAQGIINSESAFVLPETLRDIYVDLKPVGHAVPWPGLYHVEVDYRYEQIDRYAVKQSAVQFIDLGLYLLVALIAAAGGWYALHRRKATKKSHKKRLKKSHQKSSETE